MLFNAGAVVRVSDAVNAFANYSEGFSLADVGLVIRQPPAGFGLGDRQADPLSGAFDFEQEPRLDPLIIEPRDCPS